jgi:hypothetical protein
MVSPTAELNHLSDLALLIERLRDAELVPDADAVTLLAAVQAARQHLEAGDAPTAKRHVAQVERQAEALIRTQVLAPADGRGLLETARRIREGETRAAESGQTGQAD